MNTIFIRYEALSASWVGDAVTGQEKTLKCKFLFDEKWNSYPIRYMIVSREGKIFDPVQIDESNEAIVHGEALTERAHIMIGAVGLAVKNGETLRYNGRPCRIRVDQGNLIWEPATEEEATAYEKLLVEVVDLKKAVGEKLDANQGTDNAGRVLVVGEDGVVTTEKRLQADWDQYDSTAKDYVKNRTHYRDLQPSLSGTLDVSDVGFFRIFDATPMSKAFKTWCSVKSMQTEEYNRVMLVTAELYRSPTTEEVLTKEWYSKKLGNDAVMIDSTNYYYKLPNNTYHIPLYFITDLSTLTDEYVGKFETVGLYIDVPAAHLIKSINAGVYYYSQIDDRYIPGTIARTDYVDGKIEDDKSDWNQNDYTAPNYVKNRPIWKERRVVCDILAETPAVGEIVQIYSGNVSSVAKILIDPNSSNPPDCFKMIFEVDLNVNGQITHTIYPLNMYAQIGGRNCLLQQAQFHVYVIDDVSTLTEEYASKFSSAGIYCEYWKASPVIKFNNIEIYWAMHRQLIEQYIPTTIARTADIENLPKTNAEEIALLIETDTLPAVKNADGKLLSMGNKIIMRH